MIKPMATSLFAWHLTTETTTFDGSADSIEILVYSHMGRHDSSSCLGSIPPGCGMTSGGSWLGLTSAESLLLNC
jgi:hypothetical protein